MITRWIIPPPHLTRFVTDQDGSLHIECPMGGEVPVIGYLREHLAAFEQHAARTAPAPVALAPRLARPQQLSLWAPVPGARDVGSDPSLGYTRPLVPAALAAVAYMVVNLALTTHGPTPGYGPPAVPFVSPNAPPPPGFAYGVPSNASAAAGTAGRPDMLKYGYGSGQAAMPMPDPSAPGAAAMTNLNPVPGVCADCHRLAVACDAQPNKCPAAEERAAARLEEANRAAARAQAVANVKADADAKAKAGDESVTNGLVPPTA